MSNGNGRRLSACTPQEALQLLESALKYCRAAGVTVKGGNVDGGLTLYVAGVELVQNRELRLTEEITAKNAKGAKEVKEEGEKVADGCTTG